MQKIIYLFHVHVCADDDENQEWSLGNTVEVFKDSLFASPVPLTQTLSFHVLSYITQNILQHFHLYHFLMNQQQEETVTSLDLSVLTAGKSPPPLRNGMDLNKWEKKERVREVEMKYMMKERAVLEMRESLIKKEIKNIEEVERLIFTELQSKCCTGLTENEIVTMTNTITEAHINHLLSSLVHQMAQQEGCVGVMVDSLAVEAQWQTESNLKEAKKTPASSRASGRKSNT